MSSTHEDDGQLLVGGGIERLPEFALRGGALAHAGQHHLVPVEGHVAIGAIVAFGFVGRLGMAAEVAARLGAAHRVQQLGGGRRGGADDVEAAAAPVSRHLPAAAGGIGARAHGLQQHLQRRDSQGQAQAAVAVVGEEPVVAGTQCQRRAHLQRFVSCAGYLEEDLLLPLEENFPVVDPAGKVHQPVNLNHLLRAKPAFACRPRALETANPIRLTPCRGSRVYRGIPDLILSISRLCASAGPAPQTTRIYWIPGRIVNGVFMPGNPPTL